MLSSQRNYKAMSQLGRERTAKTMSFDLRVCPQPKTTSLICILYNADLFVLSSN